jgi:hypothetical protein
LSKPHGSHRRLCDDDNDLDLTTFIDSALTWGDVGVKDLQDMVDKLVRLGAGGDRIAELHIVGHGNDRGQFIGTDWLDHTSLSRHRPQLARLSRLLSVCGVALLGALLLQ